MTWDNTIDGFYLNDDGEMTSGTGWLKNNNTGDWYYYSDGRMKTGWVQYGNSWDYVDSYGKMATGWRQVNGFWYYLNSTGEMATGWKNDGNGWYYLYADGSMTWNNTVDGYHLDSTGKMVTGTGWKYVDSWWYYLNDDKVVTNWLQDQGNWYYLYPQGSMAKDIIINGWYVDSSGKWIKDYKPKDEGYIGDGLSNKVTNGAAVTVTGVDGGSESLFDKVKSVGYAIDNGIGKFSTSTKEGFNAIGEFLGLDYDRKQAGGKTQRELNEEEIQRDNETSNELRNKAPNKEIFDAVSKGTERSLDAASVALLAHDAINLGKAGINLINLERDAWKMERNVNKAAEADIILKSLNDSKTALAKHLEYIKNGGIIKPTGGKFAPSKVSAAINTRTGEIYYGYSGKTGFNPSRPEVLDEKLQALIDDTKKLAKNTQNNPYADRESFELWPVDNCAEINAVDQALKNGAKMEDIFIRTVNFKTGEFADFCDNCKVTFRKFMKATE